MIGRKVELSGSAKKVKWATGVLMSRSAKGDKRNEGTKWHDRSNSDIDIMQGVMDVPADKEKDDDKRREAFELKLGVKQLLYSMVPDIFGNKTALNKALTVMAVASRVEQVDSRFMFLWLYGSRDDEKLTHLASSLYRQVHWPTDTGKISPLIGLNICISMLLRHYWWRNGADYDVTRRPMSPTMMSGMLNLNVQKGKGPTMFHKFQRVQIFPVLETWETQADNFISQELADKGFFGG